MRGFALSALALLVAIPLTGCMDVFGGGEDSPPAGRVHEFTFIVPQSSSATIELYELNDGRQMRVAAVAFQSPEQETAVVPNPEIRVMEGDTVIIHVENQNRLDHTLHFHGGLVPWEMDGVDYLTQMPIEPGETFTYTFENLKAGTYFYHCHVDGVHHQDLGMYGPFIVDERNPSHDADREYVLMLDEWDNCHVHSNTDPVTGAEDNGEFSDRADCLERFLQDYLAQNSLATTAGQNVPAPARDPACDAITDPPPGSPPEVIAAVAQLRATLGCDGGHGHGNPPPQQDNRTWWPETHPVYHPEYNTFLINGKAFPDTPVMAVKEGETLRIRLINAGDKMHSMHIHGHKALVTHRDGYELESPFYLDTLGIMPGERYDLIVELDNPGLWMYHDHVGTQTQNDAQHPGGAMMCLAYDGFIGVDAFALTRSLDCNTAAIAHLEANGHGHG